MYRFGLVIDNIAFCLTNMKKNIYFILFIALLLSSNLFAQLDNPNPFVKFKNIEDNTEPPLDSELPAINFPSFAKKDDNPENDKYANLGLEKPKEINISKEDDFVSTVTNKSPKYFTKDKELDENQFATDQYLGDIRTNATFVNVVYRDHEYVDGDRIRVFVNDDVIRSNIYLEGTFKGFDLPLVKGFNKIDFQAINQGTSGPNTAELHIYDDNGILVSAKEWNLLTGFKATFIIVKE